MSAVLSRPIVRIRPFTPADYPMIAAISNACFPEYDDTPAEIEHNDSIREPFIRWNRYIAEIDGKAVAVAGYSQREGMYHPRKFDVDITVHPEWQRNGIATALYRHLRAELEPLDPILLRAHAQEGRMGGPEFLRKLDFAEAMRDWESRLKLADFDPSVYADALKRVIDQGIVIRSLAELADDPNRDRKLYEMHWLVTLDMPSTDERTKPTFEFFQKRALESPNFLPEGWFIAVDGNDYVGESTLWKALTGDDLYVGATGVLREYRRRGIALALKVYATRFAKEYGALQLKTWNAQTNRAMLSINEQMGFLKEPAWITFEKRLG